MRRTRTIVAVLCVVALVACGSDDTFDVVDDAADSRPGSTNLADVAAACNNGDPAVPGVIEVAVELRDANTSVTLEDCVIRLVDGAGVTLKNVTVTGGILNLHDRDTPPSTNRVRLQRSTFDMEAMLIELNDTTDEFIVERLDVTVAAGFSVRVADTRQDANDGGFVRMVASSVLATDEDAPVTIAASEHSGTVALVNTSLDTQGLLTVIAGVCSGRLRGATIDCSPDALADGLEAP